MNTPAHALIAIATLTRGPRRRLAFYALAGAVTPDLPMFGFFLWQRGLVGLPASQIWHEAYFRASWQLLFDSFHSLPAALLGLALAGMASEKIRTRARVFFGAVLLHIATDFPLHHDDAHRHFLPFSNWRFESPVSYWDPAHAGVLGAAIEVACVLGSSVVIWRRFASRWVRGFLLIFCGLSLSGYTYFYGSYYYDLYAKTM